MPPKWLEYCSGEFHAIGIGLKNDVDTDREQRHSHLMLYRAWQLHTDFIVKQKTILILAAHFFFAGVVKRTQTYI